MAVIDMIIGIGMDLVEIARIQGAVDRHGSRFLSRIFTPGEIGYCTARGNAAASLAGRFAAKEACAKALGAGIGKRIGWNDVEVTRDPDGRPELQITGAAAVLAKELGIARAHLTITHTATHAAATVVLEG